MYLILLIAGPVSTSFGFQTALMPAVPIYSTALLDISPASWQGIPSINDNITASLIATCVAGKVEIDALDLLDRPLSAQDSHPVGFIDDPIGSAELRVEEARRYDIYSGELTPFPSKTLAKVCHSRLRGVVDLHSMVSRYSKMSEMNIVVRLDRLVH